MCITIKRISQPILWGTWREAPRDVGIAADRVRGDTQLEPLLRYKQSITVYILNTFRASSEVWDKKNLPCQFRTSHQYINLLQIQRKTSCVCVCLLTVTVILTIPTSNIEGKM